MRKRLNKILSIWIFGKNGIAELHDCIKYASELTQNIFFVDLGLTAEDRVKAIESGIEVVDVDSFGSDINTDWALFIKPEEKIILSSVNKFVKMLMKKEVPGYGVHTKSTRTIHLLEDYRWVKKLEQFKNVGSFDYVAKVEPRLVRKPYAEECLKGLVHKGAGDFSWICEKIIEGIVVKSIRTEEVANAESAKNQGLRCLREELTYDITEEEDMVELSEFYTGFRLVHKGQLNGFMEGAMQGFGNLKMFIPMLDFLCKEGFFDEAKDLFETWIDHRPDDKENYHTQMLGGVIHSNSLDIGKAISWLEGALNHKESLSVLENLGKFYLIMGEKKKAIEYLKKSGHVIGDSLIKQILSTIDKKEWRPLKLSLCMIARDEEAVIEKALCSVDGIVDEIVVVDTGSTDRTVEIVKEFGAKVIETKWKGDFSKAKNLAIEHATGDYILFMDADEFVDLRDRLSFVLFKKVLPTERNVAFKIRVETQKLSKGLAVSYLDRLLENEERTYQIRLFPKNSKIRFKGNIFESLDETLVKEQIKVVGNNFLKITHNNKERKRRYRRMTGALAKAFKSSLDSKMVLNGGLIFLHLGEFDTAYSWLMKVPDMIPEISAKLGMLFSRIGKTELAEGILTKALKQNPICPDLILALSGVYYRDEKWGDVFTLLTRSMEDIEKNLSPEDVASAHCYHGIASIETGDIYTGIEQLAKARELDPSNIRYKIAGLYAFAKVDQWEGALQFAGQIADEEGIDTVQTVHDFVDVGKIFMDLNRHFIRENRMEEANLCRKIVEDLIATKLSGNDNIQRMSEIIEGVASYV